ncbi:PREDICTED: classical arabinogalactan [Prunus dulcis]|uniref:PREDICTED: classical arabinogalactan n=1 Tax=Prunus dulcis TaxID=3755 RepID=A0A5E4ECH6_PRUDU|nr:PREDICTED: classical arabinogalactan [Prunus dulcis]
MATRLHLCSYSVIVLVLFVNFVTSYNHISLSPGGAPAPYEPPPPPPPPPPTNKKGSSGGLSGGQKAGIVFGVLIGAGLIGFGGFVYKKRKDNMRRGRFGAAARTTFL